jgi:hypothetical protein
MLEVQLLGWVSIWFAIQQIILCVVGWFYDKSYMINVIFLYGTIFSRIWHVSCKFVSHNICGWIFLC